MTIRIWIPYINDFRLALLLKLKDSYTIEETSDTEKNINNICTILLLSMPFDAFCIFNFLDDAGFCTTATGIESRRTYNFHGDVQRSFYSANLCGRGLKVQSINIPNGMIGSTYVGS